MEIRHLNTFITIVELGGFSKTADHLGYAQSTITAHIQILENELGTVLFDRLGKKIILTKVGKALVPYARQMLSVYKEIKNIAADQDSLAGDLHIGAAESLSIYRLGKILKEYKKKFPKVNIILKNYICSELKSKLYSGELDITFTIEHQIKDTDLTVINLKDEAMVFIGAPESELEFLSPNGESKAAQESIIFSEKGCSLRTCFEYYLKQNKVKYVNPLEFSSIETIKKCVMNGLGVSCLPFYAVSSEVIEGSLKYIEANEAFNQFSTQLAYHKNKKLSQAMIHFIEIASRYSASWE